MLLVTTAMAAFPTLHWELRGSSNDDRIIGADFQVGVSAFRTARISIEPNLSVGSFDRLRIRGPRRQLQTTQPGVDVWVKLSPLLSVGGTAGVAIRTFRQRWQRRGTVGIPVAGVRGDFRFFRSRHLAMSLAARVTTDLRPTVWSIDNAYTLQPSPIHVTAGFRMRFGRDKVAPESH